MTNVDDLVEEDVWSQTNRWIFNYAEFELTSRVMDTVGNTDRTDVGDTVLSQIRDMVVRHETRSVHVVESASSERRAVVVESASSERRAVGVYPGGAES